MGTPSPDAECFWFETEPTGSREVLFNVFDSGSQNLFKTRKFCFSKRNKIGKLFFHMFRNIALVLGQNKLILRKKQNKYIFTTIILKKPEN